MKKIILILVMFLALASSSQASDSIPQNLRFTYLTPSSFEVSWDKETGDSLWIIALWQNDEQLQRTVSNYEHFAFFNLTPNTDYTVHVAKRYANGDSSAFAVRGIRTPCMGAPSLPQYHDFENPTSPLPDCWSTLGCTQAHTVTHLPQAPWDRHMLFIENTLGGSAYLLLPPADSVLYPVNTLQVRFNLKAEHPITCVLGVMTDPADPQSFHEAESVSILSDNQWHTYTASLFYYAYWGTYIALKITGLDTNHPSLLLDDVILEEVPICPGVEDLTVSNVTHSTATLSWTETGFATSWTVRYRNILWPTDSIAVAHTDTPSVTLAALESGSAYQVDVVVDCINNGGAFRRTHFLTPCLISQLPFSPSFSADDITYGDWQHCWTTTSNCGSSAQPANDSSSTTFTIPLHGNGYSTLALPMLSYHYSVAECMLSFGTRLSRGQQATVVVGVMANGNDFTTFSPIDTVTINQSDGYAYHIIPLSNYSDTGRHVAFLFKSMGGADTSLLHVDDIVLDYLRCTSPRHLYATSVTDTSALLQWRIDGNANTWEVTVWNDNGHLDVFTATDSVVITHLLPNTQYHATLRSICNNDYGHYSDTLLFLTSSTQGITPPPALQCSLFPNPTHGTAQLLIQGNDDVLRIEVLDLNGKLVHTCQATGHGTIVLPHLPQGRYLVRIASRHGGMVKKLVVQ